MLARLNGGFRVWQRGTSFASPASGARLADLWNYQTNLSGDTLTIERIAYPGKNNRYGLRYNRSVAPSSGTFSNVHARIDGVEKFAGRECSLVFSYIADAMAREGNEAFRILSAALAKPAASIPQPPPVPSLDATAQPIAKDFGSGLRLNADAMPAPQTPRLNGGGVRLSD